MLEAPITFENSNKACLKVISHLSSDNFLIASDTSFLIVTSCTF